MINEFKWYEPWWATSDQSSDFHNTFKRQLETEVSPEHILYGLETKLIGRGEGDDALFEILDGSNRVAQVHLTWSKRQEAHPFPMTSVYVSIEEWYSKYLIPLHFERLGIDSSLTEFENYILEFACHKLETSIFEKWIYNNEKLENEIGAELYLALISCNFSNPDSITDVLNNWYKTRFTECNYDLRQLYIEYA